jgi:hypothetical protein
MNKLVLFIGAMLLPIFTFAQVPVIQSVTPVSATVEQFSKFEARVALNAAWTNPYNYDEIRVFAVFTAPDGTTATVDGFYMEGFQGPNTTTGAITAQTAGNGFYIRFAPRQTGTWTCKVSCTTTAGTGTSNAVTFNCTAPATANNNGFVQVGDGNYFKFDNGSQYIPIGENIAWQSANAFLDYQKWVTKLSDNGGNFLRLWLCHWGLGIEWKNNSNGFSGLKKYKQSNAYYLDWLMDYCASKGVYMMFCINHHGQVSSQVNPNWSESPYNVANGGPCANTWDFFTNAQAKAAHKNRLRYIVARWGAYRSIMTWELFNEVNWTDNFVQHKPAIVDWHAEMAAYLKQNDPVQRPVSTSFGNPTSEDAALWNNPDMDYTQRHYYVDSPNLEAILAAGSLENLQAYDKPVMIGEFGLGADGSGLSTLDPDGIHVHNNLWGPLMGGSMGTGMTWWWDNYIDPRNLYYHFKGPAALVSQVDLEARNFRPNGSAFVTGAPGDLNLGASLGWGELGDTSIQVAGNGTTTPASPKLSQYLYGSVWNTQYRRPPNFSVNMPQAGAFKVLTSGQAGNNPKLVIWVDGAQVLNVVPATNQTYSVNIPAGQHTVKVDNLGTDWLGIASYTFSGIGAKVKPYVLVSEDKKHLAAWLLNTDYNHINVKNNGVPSAVNGATLTVDNLISGAYQARWINPLTGDLVASEEVTVAGNSLQLDLPELVWDLALVLETVPVGTAEIIAAVPMNVWPNPVVASDTRLQFTLPQRSDIAVSLYDAAGAWVQEVYAGTHDAGEQQINVDIPPSLANGVYWVHLKTDRAVATKAIGVFR